MCCFIPSNITSDYVLSYSFGVLDVIEKDAKKFQLIEDITRIVDVDQQSVFDEILTQNSQFDYLSDHLTFKFNIRIVT